MSHGDVMLDFLRGVRTVDPDRSRRTGNDFVAKFRKKKSEAGIREKIY